MKELALYQIAGEIQSILSEEEWTDETMEKLSSLNMALETKADNISALITIAEGQAAQCKAEEERIAALRKSREAKAQWLKSYLLKSMQAVDRTEIDCGLRKIRIAKNPPALVVDDESVIPARFFTVIPQSLKIDNAAIKDALKKGEEVSGCRLESGVSLRLK